MKAKLLFLTTILFIYSIAFAQDVKKKINERASDPKTKENAAKADVYVQKKRLTIMDSSINYKASNTSITKKSGAARVNKKKAKRKSCS